MNEKGLVSVVTATYNMVGYVGLAVESVLCQTYPKVEAIVVDDGSTDETAAVMARFESNPKVKFIQLPQNQGQAAAKNAGLEAAGGEIIGFVDADNIWKAGKLEKQLPLFDVKPKIGVVYSDVELIDGEGKSLPQVERQYYTGNITEQLLIHNFVNFNSALVKKECIQKKGLFDETLKMGIDWDLWLRISTDYEFAFLDEATYSYRIWANQMSHNKLRRLGCAERILEKFFRENSAKVSVIAKKKAFSRLFCDYGAVYTGFSEAKNALDSYIKALKYDPLNRLAWKGIVRLGLRTLQR